MSSFLHHHRRWSSPAGVGRWPALPWPHVRSIRLQPQARGPHRGVRGRRQPRAHGPPGRLQRRPDQGGVRRRRAAAIQGGRASGRSGRASAPRAHLGPDPVVGQGPQDRQPDDQRPDGDRGREARLPPGVLLAALPAAGRRLLRVVPHPAARQVRQAPQAAVLHPAQGPRRPRDGGPLRDLARPRQGRRRPRPLPVDLHRDHHRRRGRRGPHPRPDAPDGREGPLVELARPDHQGQGRPARPARARPPRAPSRPTPCPRPSATCATTAPS